MRAIKTLFSTDGIDDAVGSGRRCHCRPARDDLWPDHRRGDERRGLLFLRQDRAAVERSAAGNARAASPLVRSDGEAGGQGAAADAETVRDSAACAERVRHRPQSLARFGRGHRGLDGIDERRRTRRRHRARAFACAQLRYSDHVDCRHARRRNHVDRVDGTLGHDLWRLRRLAG